MRGKATFELRKEYFGDLLAETAEVYVRGATLDEARKRSWWAKYTGKFPTTLLWFSARKGFPQITADWYR